MEYSYSLSLVKKSASPTQGSCPVHFWAFVRYLGHVRAFPYYERLLAKKAQQRSSNCSSPTHFQIRTPTEKALHFCVCTQHKQWTSIQEPAIKNTKRATAGDLGGGCEDAGISSISNSKFSSAPSILNGHTCIELVDYTVSHPCHVLV